MPIRPMAPASPAPMTWVGMEAPPVEEEVEALPEVVPAAAPVVFAALLEAAAPEDVMVVLL